MLLVKTRIGPSKIHGIGLFAEEFIEKGTVLWEFHEDLDQRYTMALVYSLPPTCRSQLMNYGYVNKKTGMLVMCMDDARFFNHSCEPNTTGMSDDNDGEGMTIASRDIEPCEEITCDYEEFDDDLKRKMEVVQ